MSQMMIDLSNPLQARLTDPLTKATRLAILKKMFKTGITEVRPELAQGFDSYCEFWYEEHCNGRTGPIAKMSHGQLLDIVAFLRDTRATHESIKNEIAHLLPGLESEKHIHSALVLAARIWSLSAVGQLEQFFPFGQSVPWQNGTLGHTLNNYYSTFISPGESIRIPEIFRAVDINRITGIEFCWTSNLLDHLEMKDDDKTVCIFRHASVLKLHEIAQSHPLPVGLIEETLDTLALLLPDNHSASKRWFRQEAKKFGLDAEVGANRHLDSSKRRLDKFRYWGERLSILKQAFDDSEPKSVSQWWYDDRKRVQWCTFWIAALVLLLTIVFGLVQSVASVIQAWATIKSIH